MTEYLPVIAIVATLIAIGLVTSWFKNQSSKNSAPKDKVG